MMKHVYIAVVCSFLLGLGAGFYMCHLNEASYFDRCMAIYDDAELCIRFEGGGIAR